MFKLVIEGLQILVGVIGVPKNDDDPQAKNCDDENENDTR